MMDKLKNAIRSEVLSAIAQARAQTRAGSMSSYDPTTHMAKVVISPELVETGWLQILPAAVGNGFGFYVGPNIGDQVIVTHLQDDFDSGMITGRVCDDSHVPPAVPSGEIWAVHETGSFLKFQNTGDVSLTTNNDLNVTVGNDLTVNVANDVNIIGSSDVNMNVDGDAVITVTGAARIDCDDIQLGGAGGQPVARVGDTVVSGVITSGSSKVKAL